jgi:hypothetical protein
MNGEIRSSNVRGEKSFSPVIWNSFVLRHSRFVILFTYRET